jgi:hypothetical protein
MDGQTPEPTIPESFLEHRLTFSSPWIDRWLIPNPFVGILFPSLRDSGVELTDFSFNKDASNVGETYLHIAIRKLNAAVKVGLDSVTFMAGNPDWEMAPALVEVFDSISTKISHFLDAKPVSQQMTLAFHVTPGTVDLHGRTANLVNVDVLGNAVFYGISLHQELSSVVIDKSLRYVGAAFVGLQRTFDGGMTFSEIAPLIYEDEVKALNLLGISGVV